MFCKLCVWGLYFRCHYWKLVVFAHTLHHRLSPRPVSVLRTELLLVRSLRTLGSRAWTTLASLLQYVLLLCCLCFCVNARFFFVTGRFCKIRVCSPSIARPRVAIPCQVFCLRYCLACTYLLVRLSFCLRFLLETRRLCLYVHVYRTRPSTLRRNDVWTKRPLRNRCVSCVWFQSFPHCCWFCMFAV